MKDMRRSGGENEKEARRSNDTEGRRGGVIWRRVVCVGLLPPTNTHSIPIPIRIPIHVHTHAYPYIYIHMHTHAYTCIHTYIRSDRVPDVRRSSGRLLQPFRPF